MSSEVKLVKDDAKQKIASLVKKFHSLDQHKIKGLNEAATKQGFIQPLFDALGWNFTDTDEVSPEDNTSNGRVDYAFKLYGVSQFYVEAKAVKEDLNDAKYIKQAVSYAYNKGVTWAVLTNFKLLRVFNAQKTEPFISLDCDLFESDFDRLWLLSRESLSTDQLNQEAIKWGALPVPVSVEKRLFTQMRLWREQLFNQIFRYNDKLGLKSEQVDEIIQKLFHRLIFIRTAEDRGIEEKGLLALLHQWKSTGAKSRLLDALRQLFKEYDGYYDSELFDQKLHNLLDNPEIFVENETIEPILLGLYEIPGSMANYNFNDIDADVLGAVYEQYLGHVAEVMKQRAKDAQIKMDLGIRTESYTLTAKKAHRKEQGIYYTPRIITDFIVKETVGRYLKENSGYADRLHNIKILDPACGSGSFLIRAYDEMLNYHARELNKPLDKLDQWERLPILTNSIFGVDIDKQAVEITRLNLLLRSLAHREPLPFLGDNVKQGNSLVSGTDEELQQYFGADWEDKHPFNWQEKFSDVMAKGGFDIVIGNPPYIRQEQLSEYKPLWQKDFKCYDGVADIYIYFIERGLQLLKEGGFLAYITSNKYFRSGYGKKLRDYLNRKTTIAQVIDFGDAPVFNGAIAYPSIIVLRKALPNKNQTRIFTWNPGRQLDDFASAVTSNSTLINQSELTADGWRLESPTILRLLEKILKVGKPLGEYVNGRFYRGIVTGLNEAFVIDRTTYDRLIAEDLTSANLLKPFLRGRDVKRWLIEPQDLWLIFTRRGVDIKRYPAIAKYLAQYKKQLMPGVKDGRKPGSYEWYEIQDNIAYWKEFDQPKIVYPNICKRNEFAWDDKGYYFNQKAFIIPDASKYLLGVLNSTVVTWLFDKLLAKLQNGFYEPSAIFMKDFPIPETSNPEAIETLVKKILSVKAKNPDADVSKLEHQVDQIVYQLYGLTPEEIAVIESSSAAIKDKRSI